MNLTKPMNMIFRILAVLACFLTAFGATPSFDSFDTNDFLTVKTTAPWKIHANRTTVGITNLYVTNLYVTNLFIGNTNYYDTNQFFYDPVTDNTVHVKEFAFVTNIVANGFFSQKHFMFQGNTSLVIATGSNTVAAASIGTVFLSATTTNAADTIVNCDNGNGFGQLLIVQNRSTNRFTWPATQVQVGDPSKTNRLNEDWMPTQLGESLLLYNNGYGFVEVARPGTPQTQLWEINSEILQNATNASEMLFTSTNTFTTFTVKQAGGKIAGFSVDQFGNGFIGAQYGAYLRPAGGGSAYIGDNDQFIFSTDKVRLSSYNTVTSSNLLEVANNQTNKALITAKGSVQGSAGTEANPTLSFLSDTTTGFFNPSVNYLGIMAGGTHAAMIGPTGPYLANGSVISWTSGDPALTTGVVELEQGTAAPDGTLNGNRGSLYLRRGIDGVGNTLYTKTANSGANSGWVPVMPQNHTPANSSETNYVGAMTWDTNYFYIWVATNVNRRSAWSSW